MGIISTIIFGLVIGVIAKFLMPGKNEPKGFILTAILGIIGAYVGSIISGMMGISADTGLMHWIVSIAGALVLLVIYGMVTKNNATS
jgi:uncharacterized membrane protein YeaQ/YmgE (transglycosylase-associated protein family)